jgi:biopolymer transport protein ExbB/TolQ
MSPSPRHGSLAGAAAFIVGVPLGFGVLGAILHGPWRESEWTRYVEHPVEQTEVVLFCCALTVLAVKLLGWLRERWALRCQLLPRWNGQPAPIEAAKALREQFARQPLPVQRSWLGRRVAGVLDFVHGRRSAGELDDQLRTLADNDALAQDASFSLLRLIIWAIPILGFLGTVIGITGAIAGVTPETLEQSLSAVTGGLATAFDTTALALFLTMILMFLSFVVERLEQSVLQQVDAYVEAELAHRFERTGNEGSPINEVLRQASQGLMRTAEQLVEKQAALWQQSLDRMERRWSEAAPKQWEQMQRGLEQAIETTLTRHAQHLRQTEDTFLARSQVLLEGLTLAAERLRLQAAGMAHLQDQEAQLLRLQESLNNNLAAVANTGAFDQAVQSLTAAIHLLTTRVGPAPTPRLSNRPAA